MRFVPGRTVLRRYWRGEHLGFLNVLRVVADDERGLVLWQPAGTSYWRLMTPDGRTHHDGPLDSLEQASLTELTWQGSDMLVVMRPDEPWSVWWWFDAGVFAGYYVNLEDPYLRWDDGVAAGVDTADHALDIVVTPTREWRWKDEGEFATRTGHPLYWTADEAAVIRATGEELVARVEAGRYPFDGTWCAFRPDLSWPAPRRPDGWDRPRA